MPLLMSNKGFSTLQSVSALMIFASTTGMALQLMPEVLDSADQAAARYAASAETMHQEVWQEYTKAMGNRLPAGQQVPEPVRHNLQVVDGQVTSPLGGYCFSKEMPGNGLQRCSGDAATLTQSLAQE